MKQIGKWLARTVEDGTIVRARLVYWRSKIDGEWSDTDSLAVVIQRVKDTVQDFKVDLKEAQELYDILGLLLLAVNAEDESVA